MKQVQKGFTLIELMIVIAIIGILAAIAVPQYSTYTKRAKFSEVILATTQFKTPAEIAVQTGAATAIADLDAGALGIPDAVASGDAVGANVDTVGMTDGVITATSVAALGSDGVTAVTYTLTAAINNGGVQWTMSGTCLADGICSPQ